MQPRTVLTFLLLFVTLLLPTIPANAASTDHAIARHAVTRHHRAVRRHRRHRIRHRRATTKIVHEESY